MGGSMIQLKNDVVEVPEEKNPTSLGICLCIWPYKIDPRLYILLKQPHLYNY